MLFAFLLHPSWFDYDVTSSWLLKDDNSVWANEMENTVEHSECQPDIKRRRKKKPKQPLKWRWPAPFLLCDEGRHNLKLQKWLRHNLLGHLKIIFLPRTLAAFLVLLTVKQRTLSTTFQSLCQAWTNHYTSTGLRPLFCSPSSTFWFPLFCKIPSKSYLLQKNFSMFWPSVCVLMRSVFTPHFLVSLASLYAWWASALPSARNWQLVAGLGDTEGQKTTGQSCWDFVTRIRMHK